MLKENKESFKQTEEGEPFEFGAKEISPLDLLDEQQQKDLGQILQLQQKWPEAVTERLPEKMAGLLLQGLVPVVRGENGEVKACFYKEPLNDGEGMDKQKIIYRWGGLVLMEAVKRE